MVSLADYQRWMSEYLLDSGGTASRDLEAFFARGTPGLCVHQNTIREGLSGALRMTFRTIEGLLGGASFDELAGEYIRRYPPRGAVLYEYGQSFPDFLRHALPQYACLPEVAWLDLVIDQAGRDAPDEWCAPILIDVATTLNLARSLRCGQCDYAVDAIRDGVMAAERRLQRELLTPAPRNLAVWRTPQGVGVRTLAAPAFEFLQALLQGRGPHDALIGSIREYGFEQASTAIQRDVFLSSFCRVQPCPS
jgi:hypothetical protein